MRIRQVKPSWFTDKAIQTGLRAEAREFYIGLWMIADDDGWFEWDPDAIGVALYGFLPVGRRDGLIERHSKSLAELSPDAPHLVIHPCGHAQVPKMSQHQRISDAKRITSDHRRHTEGRCPLPAGRRGTPRDAAGTPRGTPLFPAGAQIPGTDAIPADPRGTPRIPALPPPGTGKERNGTGNGSGEISEEETTSEFRLRVAQPS